MEALYMVVMLILYKIFGGSEFVWFSAMIFGVGLLGMRLLSLKPDEKEENKNGKTDGQDGY